MKKLLIVLIFILTACQPTTPESANKTTIGGSLTDVHYYVVDGMPCAALVLNNDYRDDYRGITCDWSLWDGYVDGDKIILPEK